MGSLRERVAESCPCGCKDQIILIYVLLMLGNTDQPRPEVLSTDK